MTAEEQTERIERISRYANGIYHKNYEVLGCHGEMFEDFKQEMILYALMYPNDPPALIFRRVRYAKQCASEAIPYKLENMKTFSDLAAKGGTDESEFIEILCGVEEDTYFEDKDGEKWLSILGGRLFKNEARNEAFQDYMHGMSVGGSVQRDIRELLFRRRFGILSFLKDFDVISESEREHWEAIAKEMTEPAKVKKMHSTNGTAEACRRYYEKNKAYFADKAKRYAEEKRAAQAAI